MADKKTQNTKGKPGGNKGFNFYWIYIVIVAVLLGQLFIGGSGAGTTNVGMKDVTTLAEKGYVSKIVIEKNSGIAEVHIIKDSLPSVIEMDSEKYKGLEKPKNAFTSQEAPIVSVEMSGNDQTDFQYKEEWEKLGVDINYDNRTDYFGRILYIFGPFLLIAVLFFIMMRRAGGGGGGGPQIFNIGKSKAQVFEKGKGTDVSFKDVAGLEGAKEEIQEIVDFLKNPDKYTKLGAKIPKGALLVGPPGTGKTLLAKAVAGESKVPFFTMSGSDFVEMFVGVGASRVRDLFKQAKAKSPSIIFIDEIDAVGRARGGKASFNQNDERESTLNALLTEMDGFGTNTGVIILAATNRAEILDKALLRAGRFDRQIYVDMPDMNERADIFKVHLSKIQLDKGVNVEFLARQTPGFSGADIANLCNEAALLAARRKKNKVEQKDFLDAVDRIVGGLEKKNKIISKDEKRKIAFHEAGHATISWLVEHAHPLVKVTIVPRGMSLGAAWYLPEERSLTTTQQILDEMCSALGGRAAEEITFNEISTGALSDLEKVSKQAYAMVSVYGLNDKVGNVSFYDSSGQRDGFTKPYSEKTAELIDQEVKLLIEDQYERAKILLSENFHKLTELAELLLEKEVIFKEDLERIFGKRKWDKDVLIEEAKEEELKDKEDDQTQSAEDIKPESSDEDQSSKEDNSEETKE